MRVLMVARTFLPESRGGSENHAYQLSQYLLSQGHQVGVLHLVFDPEGQEYQISTSQWQGLTVYKMVRNHTNSMLNPYPFYDRQVEVAFERVLAEFKPDLLHFHHLADLSASLPGAAHRNGVPAIMTLHDFWPMCFMTHLRTPDEVLCPGPDEGLRCVECKWRQWRQSFAPVNIRTRYRELGFWNSLRRAPRFLLDSLVARLPGGGAAASNAILRTQMLALAPRNQFMRQALLTFDLLISPSRFLIGKFVEWGVPESHFRHIYNSVPSSLRQLRETAREPHERVVFCFIGTLYPPKGLHILVEAFKRLNSDQAELHIWGPAPLTGDDEYVAALHKQAAGVPNLVFEGSFAPEQLPQVLSKSDVLVLPSIWYENNPLVILEALAAGLPVVAGNAGGMAELVEDGVNGLQFAMGDAQDLAHKLRLMLDPERLERYRASIVPPWSHEEMGACVEQLYRELVG